MTQALKIDIRQSTHLTLTAELRQAIEMLQLTNLELTSFLTAQAESNPFLVVEAPAEADQWRTLPSRSEQEDSEMFQVAAEESLRDFLLSQASLAVRTTTDREIAETLIDLLDEAGYLRYSLEDLAEICKTPLSQIEKVLKVLKTFEPAGIFAQNIQECFRLQLEDKGLLTPALERELDQLATVLQTDQQALSKYMRDLRASWQELRKVFKLLYLHPSAAFEGKASRDALLPPDFILEIAGDGNISIRLNEMAIPKLQVDRGTYRMTRQGSMSEEQRAFCEYAYRSALWVERSILQRNQNIQRVLHEIFECQRDFAYEGVGRIKPLTMRDVANRAGLHESTVSRVVANKTIFTPHGVFSLKTFFPIGLSQKTRGEDISVARVKMLLKQFISAEDPGNPLSDDALAILFKRKGITVARRTLAKYRESLGIPTSHQRRSLHEIRANLGQNQDGELLKASLM